VSALLVFRCSEFTHILSQPPMLFLPRVSSDAKERE
jgi:hypothetical protein